MLKLEDNKCSGCGCEVTFKRARLSPAIAVGGPVERLCTVCADIWDAVALRPFFVEAQIKYFEENKFMAAYKAALMGQTPPTKGGFAL